MTAIFTTMATLCVVAGGVHLARHRPAAPSVLELEFTHRLVCAGFQTVWLGYTLARVVALWAGGGGGIGHIFHDSSDLLLGYFLYDGLVLLTYARRVAILYVHHLVSAALCLAAFVLHDDAVYWHLLALAVCLELVNPLLNTSWLLVHTPRFTARHPRGFRVFGGLVLVLFAATRFVWFAALGVYAPPPAWVTRAGMAPYLVMSAVWFVRLRRFYAAAAACHKDNR